MNNEIAILAQFLESLGPEVSGHASTPLSDEEIQQLEKFAAGELGSEERRALLPEILANEQAIHELVKRLRPSAS